jgi:hypothetical protein
MRPPMVRLWPSGRAMRVEMRCGFFVLMVGPLSSALPG